MNIRRTLALLAVAFVLFASASGAWTPSVRAAAASSFTVAAPPAWVVPVEPPADDGAADDARDGVLDLLEDSQMRVTATSVHRYSRHVAKALTAAGLEQISQVQFDFDPSQEALVIHYIRVRRGAETIDALRPADVSVIQPERELDDQIYSGELSALAFLRDVRPGDVVDYAYSLVSDEGYGDRFADELALGESYPVRKVRWRVLWPFGRPLWFRGQNTDVTPTSREIGPETEYAWEVDHAPAVDVEDDAPLWFDPTPVVQVSEFETWGDVVRWALPYYAAPAKLAPELERQVAEWRAKYERPEERLLAAARFVQDEVRYTGIELGPGSYQPADPSTVFLRRYGDCKDKSALLVAMLRAMGIDAAAALVNLDRGREVRNWQPSPLAFDHCIARATVGGRTYWIDSTILLQRGDLARHRDPAYDSALVIADGVADLQQIGAPAEGGTAVAVREVYTLDGDGARLEVTTTYTGNEADDARYTIARMSLADVTKEGLDAYGGEFPDVEADGAPAISDDEGEDTIRVVERYRIPSFWDDGARTLTAGRVDDELSSARAGRRTGPLAIDYPVDVTQTIEIHAPDEVAVREDADTVEDDASRFSYRFAGDDRTVRLEFHYQTLADNVPAARVAQHREAVKRIRKHLDYTIRRDEIGGRGAVRAALYGGPLVGFGALAAAAMLVVRRRRTRVREA
jgi:transglutaminase-like putative cysteine protease